MEGRGNSLHQSPLYRDQKGNSPLKGVYSNKSQSNSMCKFVIKTGKHHQFFFDLKADNGEVIITSDAFHTKAACNSGIEALKAVVRDDNKFERMKAATEHYYFIIKGANGKQIAKSVLFPTPAERNAAIKSIEAEAHDAVVAEE
jgi:Uncharacterized conserved protein